jgi:V8-like Glu-specific endopeptidase
MRARTFLMSSLVLAAACGSSEEVFIGELTAPVVYGEDDRREVFDHPSEDLRRIAQESIVALIPSSRVNREPSGDYSLFAFSLAEQQQLCGDERFANQPVAASCSGVLIADDLVLTAGHCIGSQRPCDYYQYVFNYYLDAPNRLASIRDEDVYSCTSVVLERDIPAGNELTPDFAVIQLDRPVEGDHAPAMIRPADALEEGDSLSMIGFGSGLPAKIDDGASVARARVDERDFLVANLDAFEGHSGSATFDSESRLAGILLGGRVPDYEPAEGEGCNRVNVFDDSEAGEIVHQISPIVSALCEEDLLSDEVCALKACDGSSCGLPPVNPSGGTGGGPGSGEVAADSSGCSTVSSAPGTSATWVAMLALFVVCRLKRTNV